MECVSGIAGRDDTLDKAVGFGDLHGSRLVHQSIEAKYSPKGAQGLMQLMPQTASQLGVHNAFDPQANVEAGTRYLRELLERYDFDLIKALAAYNAGPQRIDQYGGVPPYYETKAYVARIVRDFNKKKMAAQASAKPAPKKSAVPNSPKQ